MPGLCEIKCASIFDAFGFPVIYDGKLRNSISALDVGFEVVRPKFRGADSPKIQLRTANGAITNTCGQDSTSRGSDGRQSLHLHVLRLSISETSTFKRSLCELQQPIWSNQISIVRGSASPNACHTAIISTVPFSTFMNFANGN